MSSRQRERRRCLEVLGVQEDATDDDIRKAYRRMALIFHPDKNESDDAKEKFQEISYAYKYLTEGPSAVGFEEDGHFSGHDHGGHDIPIEILIRLFPWMMGDFGLARPSPFSQMFGHPFSHPFHSHDPFSHFFSDPFSDMHGFDDESEEEEMIFIRNGRITVIKTGSSNRNHGRRRNRHRVRRQSNDSYRPSPSPFQKRCSHNSSGPFSGNTSHVPSNENIGSQKQHSANNSFDYTHGKQSEQPYTAKAESSTHSTSKNSYAPQSYTSEPFSASEFGDKLNSESGIPSSKSKSKTKQQTVITSRKERKKMKKANKAANQKKSTTASQEKTIPVQEDSDQSEPVSEDEASNIGDDMDENIEIPYKMNKKQRRKLKRERERLEKEMAQNASYSENNNPQTREDNSIPQEVPSPYSSLTTDADSSNSDSRSRRAKKNEKRKQKTLSHDYAELTYPFPKSKEDEDEMLRIALELSKMDTRKNIDEEFIAPGENIEQTISAEKVETKREKLIKTDGERSTGQGHHKGDHSWYDQVGSNPFSKSPVDSMQKMYYKDMSSSSFDPGLYYSSHRTTGLRSNHATSSRSNQAAGFNANQATGFRSSQPTGSWSNQATGLRSTRDDHLSNKSSYAAHPNNPRNSGHSSTGYDSRYFYAKAFSQPDDIDEDSFTRPIDQHHEKYFKTPSKKQSEKHSFDLDEPDDVPLNVNNNKSRGVQNGGFHMDDMLHNSLNVPKGIHVNHASDLYSRK